MEINYFGNEGLTSTSANHIANLAKELYCNIEAELANITLYRTSLKIIGRDNEEIIKCFTSEIESVPTKIQEIAECKALIAWLREAIKEKERMTKSLRDYSLEKWIADTNQEPLDYPRCEKEITEEDYRNSLSVKERNRWLTVEAIASTIGKIIHKDGCLSNARKNLIDKIQNPTFVNANGRDTLIYKYEAGYDLETVDELFFELQTKQREAQAELNGIKHKMEIAIEEDKMLKNQAWQEALEEYRIKEGEYLIKYKEFCDKKRKEIRELKIVIPNNLRSIYEKINGLGK